MTEDGGSDGRTVADRPVEGVGPFGVRLRAAMTEHGPLCVGIDPHPGLLDAWGLRDDVGGLRTFSMRCVEAFAGHAALVKPQSAFFEAHGAAGVAVLEEVLAGLREVGTLSLLDVKRGDIGSTMAGYARAYVSESAPLRADALTVSPYLGFESLRPVLDLAAQTGRGVFVLTLTSNPEGATVQHAIGAGADAGRGGRSVAAEMVAGVRAENAEATRRGELGSVGTVVGATVGSAVRDLGLDLLGAGGPVLAPGLGAQGGTVDGIRATFGPAVHNVVPATSRAVLSAGPDTDRLRRAYSRAAASVAALGEAGGPPTPSPPGGG
jgi:orotidine-5'-phosphate decarboxylase